MTTSFNGKYSTKPTDKMPAKVYPCTITLNADDIVVTYTDGLSGQPVEVHWALAPVTKVYTPANHTTVLYYNDALNSAVEIEDGDFTQSLARCYPRYSFPAKQNKRKAWYKNKVWLIVFGLLAFVLFAFFVILPRAAEYMARFVPVVVEEKIGEFAYKDLARNMSRNKECSQLVTNFFEEMDFSGKYKYSVVVLNSGELNAFALPAGRIVIYSELLDKMTNYTQLSALLAHEYAHVELRHSLKAIMRSLSGYAVLMLLMGDMGSIASVVLQNAELLNSLQYSRKAERQADIFGIKMLMKKGINPKGMVDLFTALNDEKPNGDIYVSEFISTHPLLESRIAYISAYIAKHPAKYKQHPTLESLWVKIKKAN